MPIRHRLIALALVSASAPAVAGVTLSPMVSDHAVIQRDAPTWLATGTDAGAVRTAVEMLSESTLHDHYAVGVVEGDVIPLPVIP